MQWQMKKLGEVCDILDSKRKPITKKDRKLGEYPYYGATGILDYVDGYLFEEKLLLIGEDGAKWGAGENSAYLIHGKSWVNNHAHVLRPHRNIVTDEWLVYFLNASDLSDYISGMTVPKLNQAKLREIQFPLPPLTGQKQIVAILDDAFANIDHARQLAERNLKNARELFDSTLNQIFTNDSKDWTHTTIGEISSIKGGKRLPKGEKLSEIPTPYHYIRVSDFNENGTIDQSKVRYISEQVHKQIKNYIIHSTDLYISIAGTIGKTGIIPRELDGSNLTENACRLVFKDKIDNKFIYYFTRSKSFQEQAGLNTRTTAQPKLALARLASIELNLPCHSEQLAIVEILDLIVTETQRLEKIYQQKITALDELKQSLLQKAFRGELTQDQTTA